MTKQELLKSKLFWAFIVVATAACLIKIAGSGYAFGQWLHSITH